MPATLGQMPVAWHQLKIPGPPPSLTLSDAEQDAATPSERFQRRTIQLLDLYPKPDASPSRARGGIDADAIGQPSSQADRLALIDKASPHALFDLMLTEVSPPTQGQAAKADPSSVAPVTGRVLWQTAANFRRFIAEPAIRRAFELEDGWPQLALNCDPTTDRESVQALKQFHLHLIYWRAPELNPLQRVECFNDQRDQYLARQCVDPVSFLAPRLVEDCLADLDLGPSKATWLPADAAASCTGRRPLGSLLLLPSWDELAAPAFEKLIRSLHQRLSQIATKLLRALTGTTHPPAPWHRHPLLPTAQVAGNLEQLGLRACVAADLLVLAQRLRDLSAPVAGYLRHRSAARRMHCMTLSQPCYSLSLSPMDAQGRSTATARGPLLLGIQLKLFSGIGGAGLVSLPGIPSVRVVRAQGQFSEADWLRRTDFQRRFAAYNSEALSSSPDGQSGELVRAPMHRFRGVATGWSHD